MKLAVFGTGSWGTALAHHAARAGHDVLTWALEPEVVSAINGGRGNPLFLSDLELDPRLCSSGDLEEVAAHSDTWLWVVPVQHSRQLMEQLSGSLRSDVVVISASKGIETDTLQRMDEIAWETLNLPAGRFCCLSGPTFAREVVQGHPSAAVLACSEVEVVRRLQEQLSDASFRFYAGDDLIGAELAGALKNVIAIGSGVVDALGFGQNTLAALMTRGLHEITRLGVRLGADPATFRGLAGMGDLVLTCTGPLSRNRTVGQRLGRGETLEQILASMRQVAEGVRTAPAAARLAEANGVDMPITEAVADLLAGRTEPRQAVEDLMRRELKPEARL